MIRDNSIFNDSPIIISNFSEIKKCRGGQIIIHFDPSLGHKIGKFVLGTLLDQRTLTIRESITVRMSSCLTGLDMTKQVKLLFIKHKLNPNKINHRSAVL